MTIDPRDYVVDPNADISDVDLRAEELAEQALREIRRRILVPGRKLLTGGGVHSPRVQFRVPERIRADAERRAAADGVSLSVLARRALEEYLTRS